VNASIPGIPVTTALATRRTSMTRQRVVRRFISWLLIDTALINVAFLTSYVLRYRLAVGGEILPANDTPFSSYAWIELAYTLILLFLLNLDGLYRERRSAGIVDQWGIILRSCITAGAVISAIVFMLRPYAFSRWIFIYVAVGVVLLLSLARSVAAIHQRWEYRRGRGVTRLLVLGNTHIGKMVMQRIAGDPGLGYRVVGFLDDGSHTNFGRFKHLGTTGDLVPVIQSQHVDEVLVALPATAHAQILDAVQRCRETGAGFAMVPDLLELRLSQVDIDAIGGIPLIGVRESSIQGVNRLFKRVIDVAIACTALLLASPLIVIAALAIKLESPGPVFFGQVRVGESGKLFKAWKFRSMRVNAEEELEDLRQNADTADPIMFKMRHDPRRTRVGAWLRRASFDELPQCWNVLRGEMSVVGPRPPVPKEVAVYQEWHKARLQVAPGMTGLWQVSGRSSLVFDEMVMLDLYYIENWSVGLELKIILMTIPAVLTGRGAY